VDSFALNYLLSQGGNVFEYGDYTVKGINAIFWRRRDMGGFSIESGIMGQNSSFSKIRFYFVSSAVLPTEKSTKPEKDTLMGTPSIQDHGAYAVSTISGRNAPLSSKINAVCCPLQP
jgi:hypothetical protein